MDEIRWEDPPSATAATRRGYWVPLLEPLMDQPKRWAIVATKETQSNASSTAANLRFRVVKVPPGRWEFVSRTVDGEHRVYARYLGPDEDGGS